MKRAIVTILFVFVMGAIVASAHAGEYRLGTGDTLGINVWGETDLNVEVSIRPDGMITMPGIGEVKAAGKTPVELSTLLAERLKELVRKPIVTVTVLSFRNSTVVVHGPGVESRVVPLDGRTTLLQLLASIAPGTEADLAGAYLMRNGQKIEEGFEELFARGDVNRDVELAPEDRIYIPLRAERFVYVLGAVASPQAIPYSEGMTVLEAILRAGGFGKYADENDTIIVRETNGERKVINIRGGDLVEKGDLAQNAPVLAGDYVIVDEGLF